MSDPTGPFAAIRGAAQLPSMRTPSSTVLLLGPGHGSAEKPCESRRDPSRMCIASRDPSGAHRPSPAVTRTPTTSTSAPDPGSTPCGGCPRAASPEAPVSRLENTPCAPDPARAVPTLLRQLCHAGGRHAGTTTSMVHPAQLSQFNDHDRAAFHPLRHCHHACAMILLRRRLADPRHAPRRRSAITEDRSPSDITAPEDELVNRLRSNGKGWPPGRGYRRYHRGAANGDKCGAFAETTHAANPGTARRSPPASRRLSRYPRARTFATARPNPLRRAVCAKPLIKSTRASSPPTVPGQPPPTRCGSSCTPRLADAHRARGRRTAHRPPGPSSKSPLLKLGTRIRRPLPASSPSPLSRSRPCHCDCCRHRPERRAAKRTRFFHRRRTIHQRTDDDPRSAQQRLRYEYG